jgi:hypothetical protein
VKTRQGCWHSCPHCRGDWVHSVDSGAPPDSFFLPCGPCTLRQGFDAVEAVMKQRRLARRAASEETEEFSVMLPESATQIRSEVDG